MFTNPAAEEFHTGLLVRRLSLRLIYYYYGGVTSQAQRLAIPMFQLAD